jgi:hypothetical protein
MYLYNGSKISLNICSYKYFLTNVKNFDYINKEFAILPGVLAIINLIETEIWLEGRVFPYTQ